MALLGISFGAWSLRRINAGMQHAIARDDAPAVTDALFLVLAVGRTIGGHERLQSLKGSVEARIAFIQQTVIRVDRSDEFVIE